MPYRTECTADTAVWCTLYREKWRRHWGKWLEDVGVMEARSWVGANQTHGSGQAAALSIAISCHAQVMSDKQQSLKVGCRLRALEGEELWHIHVGQAISWGSGGTAVHCWGESVSWYRGGRGGSQPHFSNFWGRPREAAQRRGRGWVVWSLWGLWLRWWRRWWFWGWLLGWSWHNGGAIFFTFVLSRVPAGTLALAGLLLFDDDYRQAQANLLNWVAWSSNKKIQMLRHKPFLKPLPGIFVVIWAQYPNSACHLRTMESNNAI